MYFEAVAIAAELRDFPGGSKALATTIMPTIEALRIIRWPADRLDTLGGYLAYHNVTHFNFFLALYLGIQGARLVRLLEERGTVEFILATGLSRARIALIRSASLLFSLVLISLGLGAGTAIALAASGEANTKGAFLTLLAGGICILPFFGLGLLLSQFLRSSRVASGVTSVIITVVYVIGNISGKYRWLQWFEGISPFSYANKSRPIVPGFEVDYKSWLLMACVGLVFVLLSALLLEARDMNSIVAPSLGKEIERQSRRIREIIPTSLERDMLWRQRVGILAWPITTMAFIAVFVSMMPGVIDIWEKFEFLQQFTISGFGSTPEEQYLAMVYEILPPFLAGYLISQGSIWNLEFSQGRLQILLSTPLTWASLIRKRILVSLFVSELIILLSVAAVVISSYRQGIDFYLSGLIRVVTVATLFVLGFAGTISLLVIAMRGKNVTNLLSVYVGAAWLIGFMSPYLGWPDWIVRLSIFDAFGHPFVEWPTLTNFSVIGAMIVIGLSGSIFIGNRSPKVP